MAKKKVNIGSSQVESIRARIIANLEGDAGRPSKDKAKPFSKDATPTTSEELSTFYDLNALGVDNLEINDDTPLVKLRGFLYEACRGIEYSNGPLSTLIRYAYTAVRLTVTYSPESGSFYNYNKYLYHLLTCEDKEKYSLYNNSILVGILTGLIRIPIKKKFEERFPGDDNFVFTCTINGSTIHLGACVNSMGALDFRENFIIEGSLIDFLNGAREYFWEIQTSKVYASVTSGGNISMSPITDKGRLYYGQYTEEFLADYLKRYSDNGFGRSILLLGEPGTGKTTVSYKIADLLHGKLLALSPDVITHGWSPSTLRNVIDLLKPTVLLLDDIHSISPSSMNTMLTVIEMLNNDQRLGTLTLATSNDMMSLHKAIRRPGRFDDCFIFPCPDRDTRQEILEAYLEYFGTLNKVSQKTLEYILNATEDFPPAYIKEIAKSVACYNDVPATELEEIIQRRIDVMMFLLSENSAGTDNMENLKERLMSAGKQFAKSKDKGNKVGFQR